MMLFLVDLVGLLRWKAKKRQIPSVLTSLLKIDGEEIVKVFSVFVPQNLVENVNKQKQQLMACIIFLSSFCKTFLMRCSPFLMRVQNNMATLSSELW